MKREEMLAKLAAGESPTNVSIDKYRGLYCKVQNGEKFEDSDIGINTCALCYKHYALCGDGCSNSCPLVKTGDGCLDKEDSPYRILAHLLNDYEYNDVAWDKEKVLTAIEGMIVSLKKAQKYETEKADKDTYIEGERECGLKVGDTVKVIQTAEGNEKGWSNSWTHNMKVGYVGKIVEIASDVDSACGIEVKVEEQSSSYGYPYFVLEKVVEYAEILIANEKWQPSLHTLEDIEKSDYIVLATSTVDHDYYVNLKFHSIYRIKNEE